MRTGVVGREIGKEVSRGKWLHHLMSGLACGITCSVLLLQRHLTWPYQSGNNLRCIITIRSFTFVSKMATPADEKTAAISNVTLSDADEKDNKVPKEQTASLDEPQYDFDSEEFSTIPDLVRNVVSFEDDPTLPTITFRSVLLAAVFCIIGSIVSQLS